MTPSVGHTNQTSFQELWNGSNEQFFEGVMICVKAFVATHLATIVNERNHMFLGGPIEFYQKYHLKTDVYLLASVSFATRALVDLVEMSYRKFSAREINALSLTSLALSAVGLYTGATWTKVAFMAAMTLSIRSDQTEDVMGWRGTYPWDRSIAEAGLFFGYSLYCGSFASVIPSIVKSVFKAVALINTLKAATELLCVNHEVTNLFSLVYHEQNSQ